MDSTKSRDAVTSKNSKYLSTPNSWSAFHFGHWGRCLTVWLDPARLLLVGLIIILILSTFGMYECSSETYQIYQDLKKESLHTSIHKIYKHSHIPWCSFHTPSSQTHLLSPPLRITYCCSSSLILSWTYSCSSSQHLYLCSSSLYLMELVIVSHRLQLVITIWCLKWINVR